MQRIGLLLRRGVQQTGERVVAKAFWERIAAETFMSTCFFATDPEHINTVSCVSLATAGELLDSSANVSVSEPCLA